MFRQLVMPGGGAPIGAALNNINSLFVYHPLQLSALVETFWLNRNNAGTAQIGAPYAPWPPKMSFDLLTTEFVVGYNWPPVGPPTKIPQGPPAVFVRPLDQPGVVGTWNGVDAFPPAGLKPTNWDHLIYAYLLENTRIFDIFSKLLETYMYGEQLETPSPAAQAFWRNLEYLVFGDAMPSMLWTTSGRVRRDEIANRLTTYYWMFGIDLSHANEVAAEHPYQKPAAANRDFIPTFEAFAKEVWRGIVNARNTSGANDTDPTVVATLARRIYDMMATRRLNGNLSREEFRAVAIMSFMNLAILYDSPAVVDLKAAASSPEMRLLKMAERVGMKPHTRTKPFLDLARPFSVLMQSIETGAFNEPGGASLLFDITNDVSRNAEDVIDQYSLATGRELKAQTVSVQPQRTVTVAQAGGAPRKPSGTPAQLAPRRGEVLVRNGQ
ncbi:MAG: hypothetical protein JWN34_5134 [Bryobacterales bacterium]|nr:hypothetical protein [Bryobacterales bacterium]